MAKKTLISNVKTITSGSVPTTSTLPEKHLAFGLIAGKPKIYGNSNGVITDYTTEALGPQGEQGWGFHTTTVAVSNISAISGMRIGDYIVNSSSLSLNILGVATPAGGVVRAMTATTGSSVGNIRGPAGANGEASGFGTPTASATTLSAGSSATVEITASGSNIAKIFDFKFGIPKGESGGGTSVPYTRLIEYEDWSEEWEEIEVPWGVFRSKVAIIGPHLHGKGETPLVTCYEIYNSGDPTGGGIFLANSCIVKIVEKGGTKGWIEIYSRSNWDLWVEVR